MKLRCKSTADAKKSRRLIPQLKRDAFRDYIIIIRHVCKAVRDSLTDSGQVASITISFTMVSLPLLRHPDSQDTTQGHIRHGP